MFDGDLCSVVGIVSECMSRQGCVVSCSLSSRSCKSMYVSGLLPSSCSGSVIVIGVIDVC